MYDMCMAVPARWLGICLATLGFFSFPQKILAASVVINEIHPAEEWVELYNPEGEGLAGCILFLHKERSNTQKVELTGENGTDTFLVIEWSGDRLANTGGDTVELVCSGFEDQAAYGNNGSLPLPKSGESLARIPDGTTDWLTVAQPTKGASNGDQPANSSAPSLQPESSPSPESNPTAEYKINEVKDENGNTLSSTKVYVDGKYTHHYAPETLEFCDSCYCDSSQEIACGFGEHTIKLTKTGYEPWSETKTFSAGNSFEANPVLKTSEEEGEEGENTFPSQTPQTLGATTTTSKSPTKTYSKETASSDDMLFREATFTGEILGATESGEKKPEEKPEEMGEEKNKDWLVPLGLSGGGLVLLSTAAFPFVKPRVSKFLTRFPKKTQ